MRAFSTPARVDLLAAAVLAAALAAALTGQTEAALMVGGLALAGWATWAWKARPVLAAPTSLVGGWLAMRFVLADGAARWIGAAGVTTVVAIGAGVGRGARAGISPRAALACVAVSCAGVWACVPETDGPGRFALVLGVAAGVGAVVGVTVHEAVLGAAVASVAVVGFAGGQYRASAVVGAIGVLGVFAVAWLVPMLRIPPVGSWARRWRDLLVLGGHSANALVAARVAGRGAGVARAVVIAALAGAALTVWLASVHRAGEQR
jgi:hypothetical protein